LTGVVPLVIFDALAILAGLLQRIPAPPPGTD